MAKRKNPAAVALGRKGGQKGGKATGRKGFAAMPEEQRRAIQEQGWAARRKKTPKS
jgi:hypothetical protein